MIKTRKKRVAITKAMFNKSKDLSDYDLSDSKVAQIMNLSATTVGRIKASDNFEAYKNLQKELHDRYVNNKMTRKVSIDEVKENKQTNPVVSNTNNEGLINSIKELTSAVLILAEAYNSVTRIQLVDSSPEQKTKGLMKKFTSGKL